MAMLSCRTATKFLAGIAAAGALLVGAPIALAEPPADQCQEEQQAPPPGEQQQCEEQGPGMPDLPDLPQNQDNEGNKSGRLSDINCWMYPTGPEWFPLGTSPRPATAPSPPIPPCYYALGLEPTIPGS